MSGLIKFAATLDDVRIRPLSAMAGGGRLAEESPEILALRRRLNELDHQLAEQAAQIEALIDVGKEAFAEGVSAGREEATEEASRQRTELVAMLEETAGAALTAFSRELSSLERLAPRIAFETMDRIFGDPDHLREATSKLISHQLKSIDASALLRVEVAAADFPDQDELAQLRRKIGSDRLEICSNAALDSGACRIKLHLGTLEIGLNQQWGHMADLLLALAEPAQ